MDLNTSCCQVWDVLEQEQIEGGGHEPAEPARARPFDHFCARKFANRHKEWMNCQKSKERKKENVEKTQKVESRKSTTFEKQQQQQQQQGQRKQHWNAITCGLFVRLIDWLIDWSRTHTHAHTHAQIYWLLLGGETIFFLVNWYEFSYRYWKYFY